MDKVLYISGDGFTDPRKKWKIYYNCFDPYSKNYFITKAAYQELKKESSDINHLGDLMNKHHLLLRDNLKITVPRIDAMIENSLNAGAIGAKIIGSGGGGCIVAISEPGNEEKIIYEIKKAGAIDAFLIKESGGALVYNK